MTDLLSQVEQYLQADDYTTYPLQLGRGVFAERPGPAATIERLYVWVPEIARGQSFAPQERPYLNRFRQANEQHPSATKFFVVPTRASLGTRFIQEARRLHRVGTRVPIQFFDTAFRWENNESAATTAQLLKRRGDEIDRKRIEQPFIAQGRYDAEGDDLVQELHARFRDRRRKIGIHIVQGPAGIGKSYLFSSLFARLHEDFTRAKREQLRVWARPMPILPEYDAGQQRLTGLLASFIQTEMERHISQEVFDWMLANGQSIWMLDGLEEIMARDVNFSERILESFTRPNTNGEPTILICLRDSLMNTNQTIIDFCDEYSDYTTVYTLRRWNEKSIWSFSKSSIPQQGVKQF